MPINVQWDNEAQTVLRLEFVHPWTWEDVYIKTAESKIMLDSVNHIFDVIHDWSKSGKFPPTRFLMLAIYRADAIPALA